MMKRYLSLPLDMPLTAIANPATLDLAGEWEFQFDPEYIRNAEEWYRSDLSDTFSLPATTATAEKGNKTTSNPNLKSPTLERLLQKHQCVGVNRSCGPLVR